MADPCIIRSGEKVDITDARLSDTGCTIEPGVIIRPPSDPSVAVQTIKPAPAKISAPPPLPKTQAGPTNPQIQKFPAPEDVVDQPVIDQVKAGSPQAVVVLPSTPSDAPQKQADLGGMNTVTVAVVAAGAVAALGTAAATTTLGGFSGIQAKVASLFGTSKATVATATVVTAGTIVAVKALESKMNKLEADLSKTKKEVSETSDAIDRIDSLLNRLGD